MEERVRQLFSDKIEFAISLVDEMSVAIAKAGDRLANCLLNDHKIFLCGIGGSGINCLHFSSAMINCFDVERPPLPAIVLASGLSTLNSAENDNSDQIFARQLQALGQDGDMLVILTTNGNNNALSNVLNTAHDKNINVIVLNGHDGGRLATLIQSTDIELRIASSNIALIREMHLFILHCFCDLIDQALFGLGS